MTVSTRKDAKEDPMELTENKKEKLRLGIAFCGSFCTLASVMAQLPALSRAYELTPIFSETMRTTDTRFGSADTITRAIEAACGHAAITSVVEAEPIGPEGRFDLLLIAPCTGNTLAKLAHGVTDTTVTMAAKSHLRTGRPLVLALASNDALTAGLANIAVLVNKKHVFFVPLRQDDPDKKPFSLVADFSRLPETLLAAREERQVQPLLLSPGGRFAAKPV